MAQSIPMALTMIPNKAESLRGPDTLMRPSDSEARHATKAPGRNELSVVIAKSATSGMRSDSNAKMRSMELFMI